MSLYIRRIGQSNRLAFVINKVFVESDGRFFTNGNSALAYIKAKPDRPGYNPCKSIADEITALQRELQDASSELNTPPYPIGSAKAAIAASIKRLNSKISQKKIELSQCQPIVYKETVLVNNTGLPLEQIRWISPMPDGIKVTVSIPIPPTMTFDGLKLADINNPANGKSTFQAKYQVSWK